MTFYRADVDMNGKIKIREFNVVDETPKCYYIQYWMEVPRRVLKNAKNSWAKESRILALESLIIRRKLYMDILQRKLEASRIAIQNAKLMIEEEKKK
jgi:hypothetical protein